MKWKLYTSVCVDSILAYIQLWKDRWIYEKLIRLGQNYRSGFIPLFCWINVYFVDVFQFLLRKFKFQRESRIVVPNFCSSGSSSVYRLLMPLLPQEVGLFAPGCVWLTSRVRRRPWIPEVECVQSGTTQRLFSMKHHRLTRNPSTQHANQNSYLTNLGLLLL